LLRIAAGLSSPSAGTTQFPATVSYLPERQPARLKFTSAEYLANMGRIKGLETRAIVGKGTELLERLGLRPNPHVPWETLSKGNRQKVLLAQAFLSNTELIVLDEPYGGLDDSARGVLDELIGEALGRGATVLTSSHSIENVHGAHQVLRLQSGRLAELSQDTFAIGLGRPFKRIVLTTSRALPSNPLGQFSGVVRFEESDGRASLIVSQAHTDELLSAALALGWSVESVATSSNGDL
jgi:ABC-2 type transport system ATP-binding protein